MVRRATFPTREEVGRQLKSFISTFKEGVPAAHIREEFERWDGPLELPQGCNNVYDIIKGIKEIGTRMWKNEIHLFVRNNPKTSHLTDMIAKQKTSGGQNAKEWRLKGRNMGAASRRSNRQKRYDQNRNLDSSGDSGKKSSGASSGRSAKPVITGPPANRQIIQNPLTPNGQLIGDDFFLQLAIRELQQPIWREYKNGPLHNGLCVSGQTVRGCIKALREVSVMSNKLVIMLGAEDIYQGRGSPYIQDDFEELLDLLNTKFAYSPGAITLCTLPPMGNISWLNQPEQFTALRAFNYWIASHSATHGYKLLDFFGHYSSIRGTPKYELFQVEPRRVSGTPYAYLLWCDKGRRLAMTLLNETVDGCHGYDD